MSLEARLVCDRSTFPSDTGEALIGGGKGGTVCLVHSTGGLVWGICMETVDTVHSNMGTAYFWRCARSHATTISKMASVALKSVGCIAVHEAPVGVKSRLELRPLRQTRIAELLRGRGSGQLGSGAVGQLGSGAFGC